MHAVIYGRSPGQKSNRIQNNEVWMHSILQRTSVSTAPVKKEKTQIRYPCEKPPTSNPVSNRPFRDPDGSRRSPGAFRTCLSPRETLKKTRKEDPGVLCLGLSYQSGPSLGCRGYLQSISPMALVHVMLFCRVSIFRCSMSPVERLSMQYSRCFSHCFSSDGPAHQLSHD